MYNLTVLKRKAHNGYGDVVEILTRDDNIEDIIKRFKKEVISGVAAEDLMIQKELELIFTMNVEVSESSSPKQISRGE